MDRRLNTLRTTLVVTTMATLFLLGGLNCAQAIVYVSPDGSDETGDGSEDNPFASLVPAISSNDKEIIMASGQYIIGAGLIIPPDTHIRGGMVYVDINTSSDVDMAWVPDTNPTYLLALGISGQPALQLKERARLEWVTVAGGFYSLEMFPESSVSNVDFLGGQFSTILVRDYEEGKPVVIENCQISNGGGGVRIEPGGNAIISETSFNNTSSRSVFCINAGDVSIFNSVVQHCDSDAVGFYGN